LSSATTTCLRLSPRAGRAHRHLFAHAGNLQHGVDVGHLSRRDRQHLGEGQQADVGDRDRVLTGRHVRDREQALLIGHGGRHFRLNFNPRAREHVVARVADAARDPARAILRVESRRGQQNACEKNDTRYSCSPHDARS
jgi:hypothetical protein